MAKFRIYLSASTQRENVGVGSYGNEQDRNHELKALVAKKLQATGYFDVFGNCKDWTLAQNVRDGNNLSVALYIAMHTDAGPVEEVAGDGGAEGTTVFYYGPGGASMDNPSYRFGAILYKHIAPISLGRDRNVQPDTNLYDTGLYEIRETDAPSILIEHVFHTNRQEASHFVANMDKFATAYVKACCEYFNVKYIEPIPPAPQPVVTKAQVKVALNTMGLILADAQNKLKALNDMIDKL